jgi:hypothetical protein
MGPKPKQKLVFKPNVKAKRIVWKTPEIADPVDASMQPVATPAPSTATQALIGMYIFD